MPRLSGGRPSFREWVDRQADPGWPLLPLTHITKGISAEDIIRAGHVVAEECAVFQQPIAYFFYGRPAYRISGDGAVKVEAACPYCFIFDPTMIQSARAIFAFDTGAFANRLYKHIVMDEMAVEDFSLDVDSKRPNKIISTVFSSIENYIDGDTSQVAAAEDVAAAWEFHARAYLHLIASPGRNEPDDRICSIEVVFASDVPLPGRLKAIVVPHTLWDVSNKAPWLDTLHESGVEILPYLFVPGRHPEHYHALLEVSVRDLYKKWRII